MRKAPKTGRTSENPPQCIHIPFSSWGCGAFFENRWFQWAWPEEWSSIGIMAKELAPIVISCVIWGPHLKRQHVLFQCDNNSSVFCISKGYSKDPSVIHLLRCLWFFVAFFEICIFAEHIAGATNCAADMLSRNNVTNFFLLHPQAHRLPTPLPAPLLNIIIPNGLDWTSHAFSSLFSSIIHMAHPQALKTPTPQASNAI